MRSATRSGAAACRTGTWAIILPRRPRARDWTTDAGRLHDAIEASQIAQREGGHYGVPLMAFEAEPFFGQDRFDQLKWRMEQKGLARR
jgi:endo-1,4-beta-D-glucanase Y